MGPRRLVWCSHGHCLAATGRYALADDSATGISGDNPFPPDVQGIIDSTNTGPTDRFFAAVDTANPRNPGAVCSLT